ncbi:MAG TPA: heavy-metal-associated domain-containing protein [Bacillales bacterium]|nr:heavy-metal-associated domain-containing protein [Bacillales bacterium]
MSNKILITAAVVVILFGFYQMFSGREVTHGPETVTFTEIDLSCQQCAGKVENTLSNIIGIKTSHINPAKDTIRVTFNSGVMKASWIAQSLQAAGFQPGDVKRVQK